VAKGSTEAARDLSSAATLAELYGRLNGWEPENRGFPVGFAAGA
jgi:hypothetical protein